MALINDFNDEISDALDYERARINGYDEILSFSSTLLSEATRAEVTRSRNWSVDRLSMLSLAAVSTNTLMTHDYPARVVQIAPLQAIAELLDRLEMMRLAVSEFHEPPVGSVQISDEIPVTS